LPSVPQTAADPTPDVPGDPPDIRLVVADMDGTLLDPDGRVPASFWPVLEQLRARGIVFAPASGRQYATLRGIFADVAAGMVFIAENGAYVVRDGREVGSTTLPARSVVALVGAVRELAAGGADVGVVVCGKRSAYVERDDERFLAEARRYYAELATVPDVTRGDDEILKLAVFDFEPTEHATAPALARAITDEQLVVSGRHWVDVMDPRTDKGAAVRVLQRELGVTPAQTMAFGDYLNDLALLDAAEHSYAMGNAHPDVLARARHRAPSNARDGVVRVLREVLGLDGG
jgi:Cof subfamily protein (haloacid dehalogenase superfamily)